MRTTAAKVLIKGEHYFTIHVEGCHTFQEDVLIEESALTEVVSYSVIPLKSSFFDRELRSW